MLVATTAVRRTKVPPPVAAVLLGGALVVVTSLLADLRAEAGRVSQLGDGVARRRRARRRLTTPPRGATPSRARRRDQQVDRTSAASVRTVDPKVERSLAEAARLAGVGLAFAIAVLLSSAE
jgi:hypothetical protein